MASYQKRGATWRVIIRRKGKTLTATFDSKSKAEEWATKIESQILNGDEPQQAVRAVKMSGEPMRDLFDRYADEVSPRKSGERWERVRLNALKRYETFSKPAAAITGADIAEWRDTRLQSVKASTVNRELNLLSAVFNVAIKEWRIGLSVNPVHLVLRPKNPRPRTQRVNTEDRDAIVAELGWDGRSRPVGAKQWVAFSFCLSLATAMRKGEVLKLTWENVHLAERYAHLPHTKNDDARDVPLSSEAIFLLKLVKTKGAHGRVVPVKSGNLDKLFRAARRKLGRMHVRYHDSRREAATVMSTKLSNVLELAAVTGHRSLKMLQVYYRPKPADLAAKLG